MSSSLRLSQMETIAFLEILGLPMLVGLGENIWGNAPETCQEHLLTCGAQALFARGLLPLSEEQKEAQAAFEEWSAVLNRCALPTQRFNLVVTGASGMQGIYYFCRTSEGDALHAVRHPWIHDFEEAPHDMGWSYLQTYVKPSSDGAVTRKQEWTFPIKVLYDVRQARQAEHPTDARRILVEHGLPPQESEAFLHAWQGAPLQLVLNFEYEPPPPGDTLIQRQITLFHVGPDSWWLIDEKKDEVDLTIAHLSAHSLLEYIKPAFDLFSMPSGESTPQMQ